MMKYKAEVREVENGFVTVDNMDGEHIWKDWKTAIAHIQQCWKDCNR